MGNEIFENRFTVTTSAKLSSVNNRKVWSNDCLVVKGLDMKYSACSGTVVSLLFPEVTILLNTFAWRQDKAAHLPHVCSRADGLVAQDLWCCRRDMDPVTQETQREAWKETRFWDFKRQNLPMYSVVPRISRTSVMLSMRLDKPKSTIRMSPRGLALVSKMFWGWRRRLQADYSTGVNNSC